MILTIILCFIEQYIKMATTQGRYTRVHIDDLDLVNNFIYHADKSHSNKNKFYANTKVNCKNIKLHNQIMNHISTAITVDHLNRDTENAERYNLALKTKKEQADNRDIRRDNTSGVTGLSFTIEKDKCYFNCNNTSNAKLKTKKFNISYWLVKEY